MLKQSVKINNRWGKSPRQRTVLHIHFIYKYTEYNHQLSFKKCHSWQNQIYSEISSDNLDDLHVNPLSGNCRMIREASLAVSLHLLRPITPSKSDLWGMTCHNLSSESHYFAIKSSGKMIHCLSFVLYRLSWGQSEGTWPLLPASYYMFWDWWQSISYFLILFLVSIP